MNCEWVCYVFMGMYSAWCLHYSKDRQNNSYLIVVQLYLFAVYAVTVSFLVDIGGIIHLLYHRWSGKRWLLIASISGDGNCVAIALGTIIVIDCLTSCPAPFLKLSISVGHAAQPAIKKVDKTTHLVYRSHTTIYFFIVHYLSPYSKCNCHCAKKSTKSCQQEDCHSTPTLTECSWLCLLGNLRINIQPSLNHSPRCLQSLLAHKSSRLAGHSSHTNTCNELLSFFKGQFVSRTVSEPCLTSCALHIAVVNSRIMLAKNCIRIKQRTWQEYRK